MSTTEYYITETDITEKGLHFNKHVTWYDKVMFYFQKYSLMQ